MASCDASFKPESNWLLQVGVIVLIGLYMVIGAFIFRHIEADSQMEVAVIVYQVS